MHLNLILSFRTKVMTIQNRDIFNGKKGDLLQFFLQKKGDLNNDFGEILIKRNT